MSKTTRSEKTGEAFVKGQKATDEAINERIKDEQNGEADVDQVNNPRNRDRDADGPSKKTGGGKQKNTGM